jgi:hypothetical protein
MHYKGEGTPVNKGKSMELFEMAAAQNHINAQYWLGVFYMNGDGVPKDVDAGARWMAKAAGNGQPDARKFVANIDKATGTTTTYASARPSSGRSSSSYYDDDDERTASASSYRPSSASSSGSSYSNYSYDSGDDDDEWALERRIALGVINSGVASMMGEAAAAAGASGYGLASGLFSGMGDVLMSADPEYVDPNAAVETVITSIFGSLF